MKHLRGIWLTALALCALLIVAMPAWAAEGEPEGEEICSGTAQGVLFQDGRFDIPCETQDPDDVQLLDADDVTDQLYQLLLEGMTNRVENIDISSVGLVYNSTNAAVLRDQFSRVVNDNPRLFYVKSNYNYSYQTGGIITIFKPTYDYSAEKAAAVDAAVEEALAQVDRSTMSDLEIALVLHDYLVSTVTYDVVYTKTSGKSNSDSVYDVYGVFVLRNAVCQGYALAYKLLLDEMDIDCVLATSDSMNHAWNLIKLDGQWYHVDATWDDPVPNLEGRVMHTYFLVSDDTMKDSDHNHYDWVTYDDLTCTSTKYESGYIFSGVSYDGTYSSVYSYNGLYYYICDNYLYSSPTLSSDDATQITEYTNYRKFDLDNGAWYAASGLDYNAYVWNDGKLYYATGRLPDNSANYGLSTFVQLMCLDLVTGKLTTLSDEKTYTKKTANGFDSSKDTIGVKLSDDGTTVSAVSCVSFQTVATADVVIDLQDGRSAAITTASVASQTLTVNVYWAGDSGTAATVAAAFYTADGQLAGVLCRSVTMKTGNNKVTMSLSSLPAYASYQVMALDDGWTPLCDPKAA